MELPAVHKCLQVSEPRRPERGARRHRGGGRFGVGSVCSLPALGLSYFATPTGDFRTAPGLSDENEQLLKKLKRLRRKNQQLENDLAQIQEKLQLEQLMHDCVTSRDVQVQTESHLWHKGAGSHNKEMKVASESARILQMYNNLQKRYDREIKTNQEQSETIKNLSIKIHELEHQLQGQKQRIEQLECKKVSQKDNAVSGVRTPTAEREITLSHGCICKKKGACSCKYLVLLLLEIQKLKKKNEKLSRERRMQRNELPGLDKFQFLRTHS
ncbi:uncharacterized protein [Lepidochelys kempii]|uniref:uncharacterized protein isoform X3 n=1 Tax=Lepidochelys kempii TaxID=8472 RepID=UPI003C6FAD2B